MNPGSILQAAEHPSPSTLLPSSQSSLTTMPSSHPSAPSIFLSPQVVCEHLLGLPLHFQPSSILQLSEQPSPAVTLPSSHSSGNTATPSPQRAMRWQGSPGGVQENPGSTVRQLAAQPSSPTALPSSQASSWLRTPSPQTECCGTIERSAVTMSKEGPPSWRGGVTEPSLQLVPPPPVGDKGLTPAQAPSEVQAAAMQRPDNTFDRMETPWGPRIPAAPRNDPLSARAVVPKGPPRQANHLQQPASTSGRPLTFIRIRSAPRPAWQGEAAG